MVLSRKRDDEYLNGQKSFGNAKYLEKNTGCAKYQGVVLSLGLSLYFPYFLLNLPFDLLDLTLDLLSLVIRQFASRVRPT